MSTDLATNSKQPELEPAGAGIPAAEALFFRIVGFGLISPLVSWDLARRLFQREGRAILKLTEGLSNEQLAKRVLIPRFAGIEDSSRYWSPAMTLAHLVIVGDAVAEMIVRLSRGETIGTPVRIEDVKPDEPASLDILDDYRALLVRFDRRMAEDVDDRRSRLRHAHPWVGPLTAHQWLNLAVVHQRVHRKQIQSILKHGGTRG